MGFTSFRGPIKLLGLDQYIKFRLCIIFYIDVDLILRTAAKFIIFIEILLREYAERHYIKTYCKDRYRTILIYISDI